MDNNVFTIASAITTRMADSLTDTNGSLVMFGGEDFTLRINSPGGDAMAGLRMHAYLSRYPGKIRVEMGAMVAGVASLVAMVGSEIVLHPNSILHLVMPRQSVVDGTAEELLRVADQLDLMSDRIANIYAARTGKDQDEILALMLDETFLDASQALEMGFCTEISSELAPVEGAR
ncbi:MAG TPA: Clp protease ClpP [Devosia sp.]|jgi:ATP-dependent Clp protease protease subunit|uniref:Clp protease ClpP n=1 Tax=Devosia sp. TaxID=1871048 RepID=UPI002F957271